MHETMNAYPLQGAGGSLLPGWCPHEPLARPCLPPLTTTLNFFHRRLVLPILEIHVHEITVCIL